MARGNSKGITGPADLARQDITIVNREAEAGSRTMLDVWLRQAGIAPHWVRGYASAAQSWRWRKPSPAVRRMSGQGFWPWPGPWGWILPLQDERYDLVIPVEFLNAPPVQAVLDIAVSSPFQTELRRWVGTIVHARGRSWLSSQRHHNYSGGVYYAAKHRFVVGSRLLAVVSRILRQRAGIVGRA